LTSRKRRQDRPIDSVELTIIFKGDRGTNLRIRDLVPSAVLKGGVCQVRVEGEGPEEVAKNVRTILEKVRTIV
jgi:hypothetical protein